MKPNAHITAPTRKNYLIIDESRITAPFHYETHNSAPTRKNYLIIDESRITAPFHYETHNSIHADIRLDFEGKGQKNTHPLHNHHNLRDAQKRENEIQRAKLPSHLAIII